MEGVIVLHDYHSLLLADKVLNLNFVRRLDIHISTWNITDINPFRLMLSINQIASL